MTATTAGGVVTEESYNGAWAPRRGVVERRADVSVLSGRTRHDGD